MRRAVLATLLLSLLVGVSGAQADETPNAVYVGTHSGGGTVEFHVNPAGTAVDYIEVTDLPGAFCPAMSEVRSNFPIVDHSFAEDEQGGTFFHGTFGVDNTASGTLRSTNSANCDTGVLTWTATVADSPPPIPPPFHPPYCHVPKVFGKTLAAARRKLTAGRCKRVEIKRAYSRSSGKGRVLRQRPRPGTWLPGFAYVHLVVGRGPRP
jgi:hypothetical protein